ncbi:MAG: HDOD domain-containing protein [Methylococcaceae bacterium]|nr:HDOD domain-containing protein [Methylococcaceae bacterium]
MTPQQLASEVENLFSLPEIYFRISETIDHPKSTIDDVAKIVSQDPNISARILKISNSSFFGVATEIETLTRAVSIMGLSHLHDLVLAVSATKAFKGIDKNLVDMKSFWLHSVYCAAITHLMARQCNILDSERLFVAGILHDIGHLVIYTRLSTHLPELLSRAREEQIPLEVLEREMLGFDYAEVGGELLKAWKLPSSLYQTILNHTNLKPENPFILDSSIVHLANIMVLQDESKKTGYIAPGFNPVAFQQTGLVEEDLMSIKIEARTNMADILRLLFAS